MRLYPGRVIWPVALSSFEGTPSGQKDDIWGRSSAGRAPALQAGGQEFDSPRLHHFFIIWSFNIIWAYSSAG